MRYSSARSTLKSQHLLIFSYQTVSYEKVRVIQESLARKRQPFVPRPNTTVSNVISMNDRFAKALARTPAIRDRRYAIRYPFAADVEILDLESGSRAEGVTSDLSLGGCFVCTSRPLPVKARVRITLIRKEQCVEALAVVRVVKPRVGMGLEFLDLDAVHHQTLSRWLEQLRRTR